MKASIQVSSPVIKLGITTGLLSSHAVARNGAPVRSVLSSNTPSVLTVISQADVQNPWEQAAWIGLSLISAGMLLLSFWLATQA